MIIVDQPFRLMPGEKLVRYCLGYYFKQGEFLVFPAKFIISIDLWLTNQRVYFRERKLGWWKTETPCVDIRFSNICSAKARHLPTRGRYNFVEIEELSHKWLLSVDDIDYQNVLDTVRVAISDRILGAR